MKATSKNHPPQSLSVNAIALGRFLHAGEILDQPTIAKLPASIKRYLVPASAEPESDQQPVANFQLGKLYGVDQNNRLRQRHIERQATEQASVAEFQSSIEEQLAHEIENPDETVANALAIAAEDHAAAVNLQRAQAEVNAQRVDEANEHLEQLQAAESALADDEGFSPPTDESEPNGNLEPPEAKPKRKMKARFLRRGAVWCRAKKVRNLRPGESVYIRNGPDNFEKIGEVNKRGHLPASPYLED